MTAKEYKALKSVVRQTEGIMEQHFIKGKKVAFTKEQLLEFLNPIKRALESVADWE